jgi:hypothetical protein
MVAVQVSYAPSRELYDAVGAHVRLAADRPAGLIVHTANELPDGQIQIIDIYESMDELAAFGQSRILPAFTAAGVPAQVMEAARPTPYAAFEIVRPE